MDKQAIVFGSEQVKRDRPLNVKIGRFSHVKHGGMIRIDFGGTDISSFDMLPQNARLVARQLVKLANAIDLEHSTAGSLKVAKKKRKARRKRSRASRKRR